MYSAAGRLGRLEETMSRPCALLLLTILFTVTTVTAALAVPTKLSQQGRLLDGDGDPLTAYRSDKRRYVKSAEVGILLNRRPA
jgi:hypothetical protein